MRSKIFPILLFSLAILTCLVSVNSFAQISDIPHEPEVSDTEETHISLDDEETIKTVVTPRDSVARHQPQKPKEEREESEEKKDSILSFNFLYYIIEKYKLSDIVD